MIDINDGRTTRRRCTAVAGFLILALAASPAAALGAGDAKATADTPAGLVGQVTQQALAVLRDTKLSKTDKRDKVRDIAYGSMEFQTIARLSLGVHWRQINDAQRKSFVDEFRKHVAATYGHTTDQYTDEDIKVIGDHVESDGDATVQTQIVGTENGARKDVARVDYRLRKFSGKWKIIDVIIDNISLVSNFRSQFQDIWGNGGFDQVMKELRAKNAKADK